MKNRRAFSHLGFASRFCSAHFWDAFLGCPFFGPEKKCQEDEEVKGDEVGEDANVGDEMACYTTEN